MIQHDGHFFKRLNESNILSFEAKDPNIKMVYCCSHASQSCNCKMVVYNNNTAELINAHRYDINHINDLFVARRVIAKKLIKEKISEFPTISSASVYIYLLKNPIFVIDTYCPSKKYIVSRISKEKAAVYGSLPKNVNSIDFDFIEKNHKNFTKFKLNYKNNKNENKLAIGFASDFQLRIAKENPHSMVLGDGTFSSSPDQFSQVFSLHLLLDSKAIPFIYSLGESRDTAFYETVFGWLKENGIKIECYMGDFEIAPRKALAKIYPDCDQRYCNFHFCQALMKHVSDCALDKFYSKNVIINSIIRKYMALPYIEIGDLNEYLNIIIECINEITDEDLKNKLLNFNNYFEDVWVNGTKFKPAQWNQCSDIFHSCNNWSESFHSSFSKRVYKKHPNIYHLLYLLSEQNEIIEYEYNDLLNDPNKYLNDEYIKNRECLKKIMRMKNTVYKNKKREYLDALSKHQLFLSLKIEYDLLVKNKLKPERVEKIKQMLNGEIEVSIFDESLEDYLNQKKKIEKATNNNKISYQEN